MQSSPEYLSSLSLGTATLMREPSRRVRLRLLEHAYAAGVRAFDTAPSYGLGSAEKDLGWLSEQVGGQLEVTTKWGRSLNDGGQILRAVQAPARALVRRFPQIRSAVAKAANAQGETVAPSFADVCSTFEVSRARLGEPSRVNFLAHEVSWTEGWLDVWQQLEAAAPHMGVQRLGLSGPHDVISTWPQDVLASAAVIQTPIDLAPPRSQYVIGYSAVTFARSRRNVLRAQVGDLGQRWVGSEINESDEIVIELIAILRTGKFDRIVVGTSSLERLISIIDTFGRWWDSTSVDWLCVREDLGFAEVGA
ncbi:aldo/keto reductase [Microbacterium kunmingense]|uniref:aldo/keto reductase n=1 Tax=Microbacterium kunmingense TaxID=2915939 RepID=UPI003D721F8F